MPLPLFWLGAVAVTALIGGGKTVKAVSDNKEAKEINERAQNRVDNAKSALDSARKKTGDAITALGNQKINVLTTSVKHFLDSFEKIKHVEFQESSGLDELKKLQISRESLAELRDVENVAASIVSGAGAGAVGGAVTAFGAYSGAMALATASTGTAIGTLSGAAATNATLAFFGGGSLAAGGLGVAGGTAVLGGLVAGPALLIMGCITGAQASKNLDNAYSNAAKSREIAAELDTARDMCEAITRRTNMFNDLLSRLDGYFKPQLVQLDDIIRTQGTDFRSYSPNSKKTLSGICATVQSIKSVIDTPILTEDGKLTPEAEKLADNMQAELERKGIMLPAHC